MGGGSLVVQGIRICLSMQGDADLIPGQGTKIPLAAEQLSRHTAAADPTQSGTHVPQLEKPLRREAGAPQ